jgi:hypothetical protein
LEATDFQAGRVLWQHQSVLIVRRLLHLGFVRSSARQLGTEHVDTFH